VHLKDVVLADDVDLEQIAALTPGFTGADLANLINEAALLATRRGAEQIHLADFTAAIERIVAGLEKKSRILNPLEHRVVAYHELGHAFVAMSLPGQDPVHKISIIPRGIGALGYTIQRPTEDRFLMTRVELENKMAVLLGGRAAELVFFEHLSTGAADDLVKATDIARSMVLRYGMNEKLGHVVYEREQQSMLGPPGTFDGRGEQMYRRDRTLYRSCGARSGWACAPARSPDSEGPSEAAGRDRPSPARKGNPRPERPCRRTREARKLATA